MHAATPEPADRHLPLEPVVPRILLALAEGPSHGYGLPGSRLIRPRNTHPIAEALRDLRGGVNARIRRRLGRLLSTSPAGSPPGPHGRLQRRLLRPNRPGRPSPEPGQARSQVGALVTHLCPVAPWAAVSMSKWNSTVAQSVSRRRLVDGGFESARLTTASAERQLTRPGVRP